MDPMDPNEIQEVRKIIESSTSKVSLRDLEKKGFRKVKVLRSNDIDELIRRAVTAVVAREGEHADGRVSEELVERSRAELKQLMAASQAADSERAEILARSEALEAQLRELQPRARRAQELEAMVKELQRRLADEQEARKRAGDADLGAMARKDELERQVQDANGRARVFEQQLEEARRQQNEIARKYSRAESELAEARRKLDDAEGRAVTNESRARQGDEATGKLSTLRNESDELRFKVKQLETEKRLLQELEVPKLRGRIDELEGEARVARAAAAAAPQAGGGDMKAMFRELLQEMGGVGAGAGGGADAMKQEFAKLQLSIADSIAQAGGRSGKVTEADLSAAKVSLEALFKHDAGAVVSNINEVKFKEQTTTSDLKGKMDKLKSLRNKGGKSE